MRIALIILIAAISLSAHRDDTDAMIRDIHHLVNKHRRSVGLKELEYNKAIEPIALKHSRSMASGKTAFGHDGFKKRSTTLIKKQGALAVGENVACGTVTVAEVVQGWLDSPGHRKNIEGNYTETGIGIARAKNGSLYYTQLFCRR